MKTEFTLALFIITTALTLTGCATPSLLGFQLSEIAPQICTSEPSLSPSRVIA